MFIQMFMQFVGRINKTVQELKKLLSIHLPFVCFDLLSVKLLLSVFVFTATFGYRVNYTQIIQLPQYY